MHSCSFMYSCKQSWLGFYFSVYWQLSLYFTWFEMSVFCQTKHCAYLNNVIPSDGFPPAQQFRMKKKAHRGRLRGNQWWIWHFWCNCVCKLPKIVDDENWNRIFFLIPNSRSQTGNCFTFQVSIQNAVNVKCTEIKWFLILIFFFPLSFKMITTHHLPTHCSSVRQQHEGCIPPTFASPHSGQCTLCRGSLPGEHNFIYLFIFSCPPTKTHQLNCPFCWFEIQ